MQNMFFRKFTKTWYVKDGNGKMIRLGKDKKDAFTAWLKLANGESSNPQARTSDTPTVGEVIGRFLTYVKEHKAPKTYSWYQAYLAGRHSKPNHAFGQCYGHRLITDLHKTDLEEWIEGKFPEATENGRHGLKRCVQRCFSWAVKDEGLIDRNPLIGARIYAPGTKRPAGYQPRRSYLSEEQWQALIALVKPSDWLHDLLTLLRETGARPHEIRITEAHHFLPESRLIYITKDSAKGKKRDRVIPLNDTAYAIVERLTKQYPHGTLLRTRKGTSVTKDNLGTRLIRLSAKLGFNAHAYALRRSFITDALARGVTADVLQIVVGHSSTAMICNVYNALESRPDVLLDAVRKARGGAA